MFEFARGRVGGFSILLRRHGFLRGAFVTFTALSFVGDNGLTFLFGL